MKQLSFSKGMQDLRLIVVYHNNREMDDYIAYNDEALAKILKEIGLIK